MRNFLLLLAFVYVIIFARKIYRFCDLSASLNALNRFLTAYEYRNDLQKEYNFLLRRYSYIKDYVYEPKLDYSQSISVFASNSTKIFNQLMMIRNDSIKDIKQMFNPFCVAKEIAFFPSYTLSSIGFMPHRVNKDFFDFFFWATSLFASIYGEEIEKFIHSIPLF